MNQEFIARQTTYLLPLKSKVIHLGALRGLSARFILQNFQGLTFTMVPEISMFKVLNMTLKVGSLQTTAAAFKIVTSSDLQ